MLLSCGDQLSHSFLLTSQLLKQDFCLSKVTLKLLNFDFQVHLIALTFVLLSLKTTYKSHLLREFRLQVRDALLHAVNLIVQLLELRIFSLD